MNRWLIVALIIVVILIIVGVAYDQGAFENMTGSGWAMILAAVAAPYMAVKNMLFGNKRLRAFEDKYKNLEQQETIHRSDMDQKIQAKEKRIAELDKELQLLDAKLEVLELKKKKVEQDVNNMTIDQTKQAVHDLFGD